MDEQRKMADMEAWLDRVCETLGVDRAELAAVTPEVLDLVGQVAHGPSRPGAPMTAMVVGLAASKAEDFRAGITEAIAKLQPLLGEAQ